MFWGAFSYSNRTALTPLLGDPNSARGGVTGAIIKACLEEQLPTIASPGSIFQQDNARTHTARVVQQWLRPWAEENGIELLDFPPYSPDLNPIENLWKLLKEAIQKHHPELNTALSNNNSLQRLSEAAVEAWEALEDNILHRLVDSMNRRLQAVIRARGWYTKY
jgi:transposase